MRSAVNAGQMASVYGRRTMYAGKFEYTPPAYLEICRRKRVFWVQRAQSRRPIIKAAGVSGSFGYRGLNAAGVNPNEAGDH